MAKCLYIAEIIKAIAYPYISIMLVNIALSKTIIINVNKLIIKLFLYLLLASNFICSNAELDIKITTKLAGNINN